MVNGCPKCSATTTVKIEAIQDGINKLISIYEVDITLKIAAEYENKQHASWMSNKLVEIQYPIHQNI